MSEAARTNTKNLGQIDCGAASPVQDAGLSFDHEVAISLESDSDDDT